MVCGIPITESGAMPFFLSFTLGYMLEDGIQAIWRRIYGSQEGKGKEVKWWEKTIGYIWVMAFLTVTSPVYFNPSLRRPESQLVMLPWSVAERVGLGLVQGGVLCGGVLLKIVFGVEI